MSKAIVKITTDSEAFTEQGGAGHEIARILRETANSIEYGHEDNIQLTDANGNVVGEYSWFITEEEPIDLGTVDVRNP